MNKDSYYKKIIIILGLVVIAVFVGYFFLYKELVKKNENTAKLLDYIDSQSSREVYAVTIKKQLENIDPDVKKVQSSIVPAVGAVSFIEELENAAHNNGLTIKNDSIIEESDPKLPASTVVFLKIKSTIHGPWSGIYKFISELETMPYKIRVNSFGVTTSGADSGAGLKDAKKSWDGVFEIRVLKYK